MRKEDMCWITLSPKEPHHTRHHTPSAHGSIVEQVVRVHHGARSPRFNKVNVVVPSMSVMNEQQHHDPHHPHLHHLHPHLHHLHPLHMHPLHPHHLHHHRLQGSGKRRHVPAPRPPTPSKTPSSCPSPREPVYRTQIVEPRMQEVQETTRVALRQGRAERRDTGRLRRVAGYEVLGREVPWDWDCVSSAASGEGTGKKRARSTNKGSPVSSFPPFGSMDRWM